MTAVFLLIWAFKADRMLYLKHVLLFRFRDMLKRGLCRPLAEVTNSRFFQLVGNILHAVWYNIIFKSEG